MRHSPITFASLLGLLFTLVLFPEQVNASCGCKYDHACFPAIGVFLKLAVKNSLNDGWNGMIFGDDYGSSMLAFNQDISGWDLESIKNMQAMFYGASSFNQNLCAWKYKDFPYGFAAHEILQHECKPHLKEILHRNMSKYVYYQLGMKRRRYGTLMAVAS